MATDKKMKFETVNDILEPYKSLHCVNCGNKSFDIQFDADADQLYDLILNEVIGKPNRMRPVPPSYDNPYDTQERLRATQRAALNRVFGKENS